MASRTENRLHLYKQRAPLQQEARRKKIAAERREQRDTRRTNAFAANRGIQEEPAVSTRQQKLEEWKKRRQVAPKAERVKKEDKPAFVFTKISYDDMHLYRPLESTTFCPPKGVVPVQSFQPERQLRSRTRNQLKGIQTVKEAVGAFTSAMAKATSNRALKIPKPQIPVTETKNVTDVLNRTFDSTPTAKDNAVPEKNICQWNSENAATFEIVPDVLEKPSHSSSPISQNICQEMVKNKFAENHVEQIQIRKSSRKSSAKKDVLQSIPSTVQPEVLERVLEQPVEEKSADYYRSLHSDAVAKLNSLCIAWTNQKSQGLPDSVSDDVDVAVGNAQLLISQRLQQYLDLIIEHENTNCSTEMKVLTTDLDGFWGLVNNQVENIYSKFDKLETLKLNNWQDSNSRSLPVKEQGNITQKPKVIKSKGNASSGLRSFLAQARRQAKTGVDENSKPNIVLDMSSIEGPRPMSPVVMRVTSRAKQLGSPQTSRPNLKQSVSTPRNPLHIVQPENAQSIVQTPKSTRRTPYKRALLKTPGSTPMRRSARLLTKVE